MGHEPQEIECKIACLNVNFYGVALVMFSKGSKPSKKLSSWYGGICGKGSGGHETGAEEGCIYSTPGVPDLKAHCCL